MSDIEQRFALRSRSRARPARSRAEIRATASRTRTFKGPQDYILELDAQVERVIRERILAAFPNDSFFGEEGGGEFGRDVWVVDPIDGTSNFARRIPHWCISIAFVRDMKTEVGVIYQPPTDEMYAARRGGGATLNGQAMKASGLDRHPPGHDRGRLVVAPAAGALRGDGRHVLPGRRRRCGGSARARSASPMWRTDAATAMSNCT